MNAIQVGRVAALVVTAQTDLIEATREALADGDKSWVQRHARQHYDTTMALWLTLMGLRLADEDRALALARDLALGRVVAHVAPF